MLFKERPQSAPPKQPSIANCSFSPSINKSIPNFKQLQKKFEDHLRGAKNSLPLTKIQEFSFSKREADVEAQRNKQSSSSYRSQNAPKQEYAMGTTMSIELNNIESELRKRTTTL